MLSDVRKDVLKVLILAVVLTGLLLGVFVWNQQTKALDPLAHQVYALFVSR